MVILTVGGGRKANGCGPSGEPAWVLSVECYNDITGPGTGCDAYNGDTDCAIELPILCAVEPDSPQANPDGSVITDSSLIGSMALILV